MVGRDRTKNRSCHRSSQRRGPFHRRGLQSVYQWQRWRQTRLRKQSHRNIITETVGRQLRDNRYSRRISGRNETAFGIEPRLAIPISFYISLRRLFTRRIIGDSRPHHTTRRVRNNRLCSSNSIRTDKKRPSKQRPPFRERPLCQQTYLFENTSGYGHSFGSKRNIRFGESRQTVARHHRTRRYTR